MTDPKFYPELACHLAPLREEDIPLNCSCVICQRRRSVDVSSTPEPYVCPVCTSSPEGYYGRLVFAGESDPPTCPNHRASVLLTPVH